MALDREEFKRRREERDRLRQKQEAQRKRTLTGLAIAAVVLLLVGVLIFVVTRTGSPASPSASGTTVATTQPPTTAPAETTQATEPPSTVIHIAAAGDLNINDHTVGLTQTTTADGEVSSQLMLYDYTTTFMDVVSLLSEADLTVLNFEGNLCGAPYGTDSVSAPQTMMEALRSAGVDLIQMANSRCIANGISGLGLTLQNIRAAGLEPVGAYGTESEFRQSGGYTIRTVNGVRVAFVAFTKGMDGMALPAGSEQCVNLLYTDYATTYRTVDTKGITKILRSVKSENPDITIALLHWGSEFNDTASDTQDTIKNLMLAEGVDAIIGTHPHYVQKMEFDETNGTFVAYSLGDFFSDAERGGTEYSVVLDLEITKNTATGETKITGYSYTPTFTVVEEDGTRRVVRLEAAVDAYENTHIDRVSQETYEDMLYALERIQARIHPKSE